MPNWCNNTITLKHENPEMIVRAQKAFLEGELLQEFAPCPQELIDTSAGWQEELEEQEKANVEKYGYRHWYDFCVSEWGTKWDVGHDEHEDPPVLYSNGFSVSFDSAWSPPCEAYNKLKELGYLITAYYYEPGCDFCGRWVDGVDDCYCPSKEKIPQDIVDEMGIPEEEFE